ncbi:MAG: ABC transporter permease subunit [Vicinamibacterales bacterium]
MANTIRNISAIAGRELRSYFGSPVAWVLMGFFAFAFGYFFNVYLDFFVRSATQSQFGAPPATNVNNDMIRPLLGNTSVLILFLLPMITMRTYSEEKRSGTIELLLTSPLTDLEITLGKFFGAVGVYLGLLAVTMLYVAVLYGLGHPEWKPLVAGYLGLLLLGSAFISLGLFVSSTTKNQMLAGGVTFLMLLLLWIINWFAESAGPTFGPILNYLSVTQHLEDFSKGVIDTKHLIFYMSVVVFGLFLTLKSVDTERWRG